MAYNGYSFLFNPLAKFFKGLSSKEESKRDEQIIENSVTTSEDDFYNKVRNPFVRDGNVINQYINFDQVFTTKKDKIQKYREMENYPEINDALDVVCDEAIHYDVEGKIVHLAIKDEEKIPRKIVNDIREQSDFIIEQVLKLQDSGWLFFRRFLVEGELFLEKIPNDKKDTLLGYKIIPAFRIIPFYQGNIIKGYVHGTLDKDKWTEEDIELLPEQVAYVNWGEYINGDISDPKSYLYPAIRTYNQLRNLEDSLVVYRLTRAIEKRIFNIEVGQMPTGKAREFINKLINQYKKNAVYDSNTGMIQQQQHLMSLNEDFWFAQQDGKGSRVETLQSGMNLGELKDIDYFLRKLYKTLKMPRSRWEENNSLFGSGKGGEISREEIKFSDFVERIQKRFKKLLIDFLITQLKMKGFDEQYLNPGIYDYMFTKANYFAEYKEMELIETRLGILNNAFALIWSPSNPAGLLDEEFVLKQYFKMTDEEYLENKDLLDSKRDAAMDAHLETQDDLKQIEFGVADMAQDKKNKEKAEEGGFSGKGKPPKKKAKGKE